jgi:hypothetical protein
MRLDDGCQVQLQQQAQEVEKLKAALERCAVRVGINE